MAEIIRPTVAALARRGIPYRGVLYAGLMIDAEGPKLIEYNARFGDPECQVLMLRLKDDLLTILNAAVDGVLDQMSVRWRDDGGAHASSWRRRAIPAPTPKGSEIRGLDAAAALPDVEIFHAGTRREGGRIRRRRRPRARRHRARRRPSREAQARAYEAVDRIDWPEGFCRRDIGWRAVARRTSRRNPPRLTESFNLFA